MEQVEDVLPTLFGPDDRFRTVRATIRHSRDVDLERRSAGIGRPALGRDKLESGGGSKSPRITTSVAKSGSIDPDGHESKSVVRSVAASNAISR